MPHAADPAEFDVVIIGSGFGGSVAANRLATAGQRVLLLERGPWRDSLPVRSMGVERRAPFPCGRKAFTHLLRSVHRGKLDLRLNKVGMYELFAFPGLGALVASAVGGGSTAYGGLLQPPRNTALWRGRHPELDPADIERYYSKVIDDMGGVRLSREHPLPQSVWTHFPIGDGGHCQAAKQQPHMGLLIPPTPADAGQPITTASGLRRQYCAFDGDGMLGSYSGAKASVDFVYLAPVLDRGATVRDMCEVTHIQRARPVDGNGYLVRYTDLATRTAGSALAARVILAAGTMNTLRLLFGSVGTPDGLAPMPALGRRFTANGDLVGVWSRKSSPVSAFASTPSLGAFTVEGHESPEFGFGGFPGFQTLPVPSLVKRRLEKLFFIYGMGADRGSASVSFEGGRLGVDYDWREEPIYAEVRAAFHTLAAESGHWTWALGKPITVHAGGGACLGADANSGVVDHRGEAYGNPGLFVVDGAALPAPVGGPPSVAIASWAYHVADGIARATR